MKGTIVVGSDTVKKTVDDGQGEGQGQAGDGQLQAQRGRRGRRSSSRAPTKRTVKTKRLSAGKQTVVVKKLKAGSYKGTLTLSDDFDNKTTQKKSFKVG